MELPHAVPGRFTGGAEFHPGKGALLFPVECPTLI